MKEYYYGQVHVTVINAILEEYAEEGWEVQWMNRNHNAMLVDILFVRDVEQSSERYVDLGPN